MLHVSRAYYGHGYAKKDSSLHSGLPIFSTSIRRSESCKMTLFQRDPRAGLFFGGDRVSGQEVRDQNGTSHLLFSATYTGLKTI